MSKIYPEHIILGIVREGSSIAARFLRSYGLNVEKLREKISENTEIKRNLSVSVDVLPFSPSVKILFKESWDRAQYLGANYINPEHIFISLLCNDNTSIHKLFEEFKIDIEKIKLSVIRVVEKKKSHLFILKTLKNFNIFRQKIIQAHLFLKKKILFHF